MRLRKTVKILGIVVGVLAAIALFAPLQVREYACTECGSYRPQLRVLYIPVLWRTGKPGLWRYWLRHVDAEHRHQWVELERMETLGLFIPQRHATYLPWGNLRWKIKEQAMIRMLRALPDARSRKEFVNALWRAESTSNRKFRSKLNNAYWENPRRTDWPRILREMGARAGRADEAK